MTTIGLVASAIAALLLLFYMIRIVPEYQRIVILRLGRVLPLPKGPGIIIIIPVIDVPIRVDLREQFVGLHKKSRYVADLTVLPTIDFTVLSLFIFPLSRLPE